MSLSTHFVRAVVASCMLASVPARARAAEVLAQGPHGCPDARELTFRVERRLNMPLARAAPLHFDVTMEQFELGHRARIDVTPGGLRREITASNCEELADAVSIAIALALGSAPPPEGLAPAASRAEASLPPPVSQPAPAPAAGPKLASSEHDVVREGPRGRAASPQASVSLSVLADVGSLPAAALGAGLGAEALWRRFELHLLATLLFEQETQVDATVGAGAALGLWTGAALGCTLPWAGERRAPIVCLGLEVGRLAGEGTGVSDPRSGSALWVAPVVQLGAAWAVPDSALTLNAALLGAAPLNRDEFTLRGVGSVHQSNAWIGRLSIGVGFGL